ncbi:MAG: hypothetical protein ABW133_07555, partial [Polyangiaceae bacterium]
NRLPAVSVRPAVAGVETPGAATIAPLPLAIATTTGDAGKALASAEVSIGAAGAVFPPRERKLHAAMTSNAAAAPALAPT